MKRKRRIRIFFILIEHARRESPPKPGMFIMRNFTLKGNFVELKAERNTHPYED